MNGSLPEVSINARLYRRPQVSATRRPVSIPPVKATMCVSECSTSCRPAPPPPVITCTSPRRKRIECLDELQRGQRGEVGRLDDHGVAAGERGGRLPAQQAERIIERQNDHHHAERVLGREMKLAVHGGAQHFAAFVAGDFRVIVDRARRPGDLVERLLVRLAHLAGQHLGHERPVRHHPPRHFVQQLRAPVVIHAAPGPLRGVGGATACSMSAADASRISPIRFSVAGSITSIAPAPAERTSSPAILWWPLSRLNAAIALMDHSEDDSCAATVAHRAPDDDAFRGGAARSECDEREAPAGGAYRGGRLRPPHFHAVAAGLGSSSTGEIKRLINTIY